MEESTPETAPTRRSSVPGGVWTGLVLYHALIPVGGLLIVIGTLDRVGTEIAIGAPLLILGIALQLGIIRWSVHKARMARAGRATAISVPPRAATNTSDRLPRFCPACGWSGRAAGPLCERCGRWTVAGTVGAAGSGRPS